MQKKEKNEILRVKNLKIQYGKKVILENVNFSVDKGSFISILGPSGSGKTTLLNSLASLVKKKEGEILINNSKDNQNIGFVFQDSSLYENISVYKNIYLSIKNSWSWKIKELSIFFEKYISDYNVKNKKILNLLNEIIEKREIIQSLNKKQQKKVINKLKLVRFLLFLESIKIKYSKEFKQTKTLILRKKIQNDLLLYQSFIDEYKIQNNKITALIDNIKKEQTSVDSLDHKSLKKLISKLKMLRFLLFWQSVNLKLFKKVKMIKSLGQNKLRSCPVNNFIFNARVAFLARKDIIDVSKNLDIMHLLKNKATALSGGQKQRVSIAKALAKRSDIILLDEPFASLDAKIKEKAREWLKGIQKQYQITMLFVTHDQNDAMLISDKIIFVDSQTIVQFDEPKMLFENPVNLAVAKFIGFPEIVLLEKRENLSYYIRSNKINVEADQNGKWVIKDLKTNGNFDILTISSASSNNLVEVISLSNEYKKGQKVNIRYKKEDVLIFDQNGKRIYV
ncbi:ATP-binding cassette domain-containing protein [Mycoplasmopsis pulmonis]|nr:ATP-binding cassette domain-containing protein [Mycoplasmopsis pulmonis]MDZ7293493.1 ATP-binding cassette domain-containing protein [Mycoplasmopsis pulmonis]VEU68264.1 maltodextrin ABC transporter ATP-binding protein [Mycoplasmopsis pulmonis]